MKKSILTMMLFSVAATMFLACNKDEEESAHTPVPDNVVDLGLPSGILWATCNVGAEYPWDYGGYFAWGETTSKTIYNWGTYKHCNGTENSLTKYNYKASYGSVDNKIVLESSDDVAAIVFGDGYSIPTKAEWLELIRQCYWVWTSNYNEQNVSGYIVYRAKSNGVKGKISSGTPTPSYTLSDVHIFLPAAGGRGASYFDNDGEHGYYWSSSLYVGSYPDFARSRWFDSTTLYPAEEHRFCGLSVRPVYRP